MLLAPEFLHDFVQIFWPSVRAVAQGHDPVAGYYSGPFLLLELWPFSFLPLELAKWLWFAASVLEIAVLAWVASKLLWHRSAILLCGALLLTSTPILDSLLMGQVAVLAACLLAMALLFFVEQLDSGRGFEEQDLEEQGLREQKGAAGVWATTPIAVAIGLAIAVKPSWLAFILLPLVWRQKRLFGSAVLTLVLAELAPVLLFGPSRIWHVSELCFARVADLHQSLMNAPDSQHLPHLAQRYLQAAGLANDSAQHMAWLRPLSWTFGSVSLLTLLWRGVRRPEAALVALLALGPFFVGTSWPLDFALLPLLQACALARLLDARELVRWRLAMGVLLLSMLASNILSDAAFPALLGYDASLAGAPLAATYLLLACYLLSSEGLTSAGRRLRPAAVLNSAQTDA